MFCRRFDWASWESAHICWTNFVHHLNVWCFFISSYLMYFAFYVIYLYSLFLQMNKSLFKKTQTHILQKTAHKITHIVVCLFLLIWTRWKYEKLIINKLHSCSIQLCVALCSVAHLCIWPLNVWCIYCLFTAV